MAHCNHKHEDIDFKSLQEDPTLASCCLRDQRNYNKAMELKKLLLSQDPTTQNVYLRQEIFQPKRTIPDISRAQLPTIEKQEEIEFDSSDEEFLNEMNESSDFIQAQQVKLMQEYQKKALAIANGYGIVLSLSIPEFIKELNEYPDKLRVVYIAKQSFSSINYLQEVASRYLGTKFYHINDANLELEDLLQKLNINYVTNAKEYLAAYRFGVLIDIIAVQMNGKYEEITYWDGHIMPWLMKCNILQDKLPPTEILNAKNKIIQDIPTEDIESGYDCGIESCRLRYSYEHEHIGASKETKQEISAWRQ